MYAVNPGSLGEETFFAEVTRKYPEFEALFKKSLRNKPQNNGQI